MITPPRWIFLVGACVIALFLQSCGTVPRFAASKNKPQQKRAEKKQQEGKKEEGKKQEKESDVTQKNSKDLPAYQEGIASYYGDAFDGRTTSNGETFDMYKFTAAHRTYPFGTKLRVKNLDNGRSIIVRVNDRGPYVDGRLIDVSYAAAKQLEMIGSGTAHVRIDVMEFGDGK